MFPTGRKFGQSSRSSNCVPSLLEQVVRARPSENPFSQVPVGGSLFQGNFSDPGLLSNQISHTETVTKEESHEKNIHVDTEMKGNVHKIVDEINDEAQEAIVVTPQNLTNPPSSKFLGTHYKK